MNIKLKLYRSAIGMALAANLGFAQAAELDDLVTPVTEPLSMEPESPQLIEIEYGVEGETLFIVVDGIGLEQVKHFTFNGQIIDDFISDGRETGLVTIEEEPNMFLISASLPSSQAVVGGVFGVVTSNGTTVSSDIPSDLLSQSNTEPSRSVRRKSYCYVTYRLDCPYSQKRRETLQIYLGWASSPFCGWRKRRCRDWARSYAHRLSHRDFGLTGQQFCDECCSKSCFEKEQMSVSYYITMTGCGSEGGSVFTDLDAHRCYCVKRVFR